jgi:hypothetical protein
VAALLLLLIAAAYDARCGTIPLLLLLASLAAAALAHRNPVGAAYGILPLAIAWRTNEAAFGYGDALAIIIIGLTLSPLGAPVALIAGGAAALIMARVRRVRATRLLPYLTLAACALVAI